jgi:hypothetical protein
MNNFSALATIFSLLLMISGCGEVFLRPDPRTGKFRKVARMSTLEEGTYQSIDSELAKEANGQSPSAGKKSWREYWEWSISLWREHGYQKYEDYFYRRRKEMGLKNVGQL